MWFDLKEGTDFANLSSLGGELRRCRALMEMGFLL